MIDGYGRRAEVEIAREREAWRLRKEDEVALPELKSADSVQVKKAGPIEKEAEGRIFVPGLADGPLPRAAHDL